MKVLILGAGNVGITTCNRLAANHEVALLDIEAVDTIAARLADPKSVRIFQANACDEAAVARVVNEFVPDVLVCGVGTIAWNKDKIEYAQFKAHFEINFFGNLIAAKAVLPGMIARKAGHIVLISSSSGHHAPNDLSSYGPSKWAIENVGSSLRAETKRHGISVDMISPTSIRNVSSKVFTFAEGIPAELVAAAIERSIGERRGTNYYVPAKMRLVHLLERLCPWFMDKRAGLPLFRSGKYRKLRPRSALITGASSGLGAELALLESAYIERLYLQGRNRPALEELAAKIRVASPSCKVELVICDFADDAGVEACIAQVPAVDMIVNNAGFHVQAEVCDTSVELFQKITQVNFYAPARLLGHYLALPAAERPKRIVNVLSTGAIFGRLDLGAYSATKGALWSLTRSIRRLFGDIHVVEVLPSNFESNLFKSSIQVVPTGRKWSPVYGAIPSAREAAQYITGQVAKGREIVFFPRLKLLIILVLEALFPKFIRKRFS